MTPKVWQEVIHAPGNHANANDDESNNKSASALRNAFDILTPALPGHDDAPALAENTLAAWGDALADTLPPQSILGGWSLGALLALDIARRHPEKVARLVLIGATPRFVSGTDWRNGLDANTVAAFVDGYATQPATTLRHFLTLQTLGERAGARHTLLPRLAACQNQAAQNQAAQNQAGQVADLRAGLDILVTADLRPTLADIRQPAHLIHGAGDALMPLAAAHWLAAHLPRASLNVLPHCGHAPLLSAPAACAAILRQAAQA
jgi:pimeloyl-[acyl-carrier protein] methyl ester esterase